MNWWLVCSQVIATGTVGLFDKFENIYQLIRYILKLAELFGSVVIPSFPNLRDLEFDSRSLEALKVLILLFLLHVRRQRSLVHGQQRTSFASGQPRPGSF